MFQVHGFHDWYLKLKEQKDKNQVNLTSGLLELTNANNDSDNLSNIDSRIQQQIAKYFSKGGAGNATNMVFSEEEVVDSHHYAFSI